MKKRVLFLGFCLAFSMLRAQTEFAPIGAEWYYNYVCGLDPRSHFNHVVSESDTIIEGYNCRVLRQYYDTSNIANKTYILKQEQRKIY